MMTLGHSVEELEREIEVLAENLPNGAWSTTNPNDLT
jgi:hypothetical protein